MPNQFQKSFQSYVSKITKRSSSETDRNRRPAPRSLAASARWILRGCKYPRTISFRAGDGFQVGGGNRSDDFLARDGPVQLPDFSGSRILVPPAVGSSSLIEEAAGGGGGSAAITSQREGGGDQKLNSDDFIMVIKNSDNLYDDFIRSMKEMVDARVQQNGRINWDFMEELLICYLDLNDKKCHRHILAAFVDLVAHLRGEDVQGDGGGGGGGDAPVEPHGGPSSSKGKEKVDS